VAAGTEPAELLARLAQTMRRDIAPAVADEYARTQAFMASVILGKLAAELTGAADDAAASAAEHGVVAEEVRAALPGAPAELVAVIDALAADGATARWNELVAALHASRPQLDPAGFAAALAAVRRALRARLDRALRAAR
jgi:hypothetical protein